MKKAQTQIKAIAKQLASLTKKLEKLSTQVAATPAKAKAAPKKKAAAKKKAAPKKAASKKAAAKKTPDNAADNGKNTVLDSVMAVINKSRGGANIATLKEKTGLESRQLSNALYKLSKKKLIKSKSRGVYIKA
jgi:hypothetical protein